MKFIIILVTTLFASLSVSAFEDVFKFNTDVFKCQDGYKSIFGEELKYGVYNANPVRISATKPSFQEELELLVAQLKLVSPSRANLLKDLLSPKNSLVTYKKNIRFLRSSPPSNLVSPEGCSVEPLTHIEFTESGYRIIFNQDIFDALTIEDKLFSAFNLSLDIEQVIFGAYSTYGRISSINMNQVHAREFMACWFDQKCKPNTLAEMHKIASNPIYHFSYLEQDGMVMPFFNGWPNEFKFDSTNGNVISSKYAIGTYYENYMGEYFTSKFFFKGKQYTYAQTNGLREVSFHQNGKVNCVPKIPEPISIAAINDGESLNWNHPCFDENSKIQSINFPDINLLIKEVFIRIDGKKVFPYKMVAEFRFYPDEKLNWISNVQDQVSFNNQLLPVDGMLKLYPSGKIQCLQLGESRNIKTPNGQFVKVVINQQRGNSDLFCFKEDGNFDRSYNTYYMKAIKEVL